MSNNDLQRRLEEIKGQWDSLTAVVPDDLTPWGFPELTRQHIADALAGLAHDAGQLAKDNAMAMNPAFWFGLSQLVNNLSSLVLQHIPSNAQGHLPGLLSTLEQLRASMASWVREGDLKRDRVLPTLAVRLSEMLSRLGDAAALHAQLKESANTAGALAEAATKDAVAINEHLTAVKQLDADTKASADATADAATRAEDDAAAVKELMAEVALLREQLQQASLKQVNLFTEFETRRETINGILADANRTGMASAFITRKEELDGDRKLWRSVFGLSLGALALAGVYYFAPTLSGDKWVEALLRLPLTAPLVWLAWFAAKQYGYASRLREDYAYKVAASMAFEGYKREAGEIDGDMQKKLLETAVTNFGDNPLRIYNGHENHASPMHELFEQALKDETIAGALKEWVIKKFK